MKIKFYTELLTKYHLFSLKMQVNIDIFLQLFSLLTNNI
jgi:hypothetical protein